MEKQLFKLPKNIRQCGMPDPELHIYMEEYVKNYIEETDTRSHDEIKLFILVGEYMNNDKKLLFISGAIEIKENSSYLLDEEKWRLVYEKIRSYFPDKETVGWVLAGSITVEMIENELFTAHMQNFGLGPKVLYIYNWLEKREVFFTAEADKLRMCLGYNIYYSKNEEMQNYMLECENEEPVMKKNDIETEAVSELSIIKRLRDRGKKEAVNKDKLEISKQTERKEGAYTSIRKLSYTAAFFLMLVACAVSLILLRGESKGENSRLAEKGLDIQEDKTGEDRDAEDEEYLDVYSFGSNIGKADESKVQAAQDDESINIFERKNSISELEEQKSEAEWVNESDMETDNKDANNDNEETSIPVNNPGTTKAEDKSNTDQEKTSVERKDEKSNKTATESNELIHKAEESSEVIEKPDSDKAEAQERTDKEDNSGTHESEGEKVTVIAGGQSEKETEGAASGTITYTVAAGDTLAGIARKYYGDMTYITKIKKLNGIENENMITIGQKILLPD